MTRWVALSLIAALALAIVPPSLFDDAPDCVASADILTTPITVTPMLSLGSPAKFTRLFHHVRGADVSSALRHLERPMHPLPSSFGGATASFTRLHCLFLVYRI